VRGFITLPLMGWLAIAAAVAFAGMGLALKVQGSRLEAAKAELAACAVQYETALKSIERQNKGVADLKAASEKAIKRARIASEQARKGMVATQNEIARLRGSKGQTNVCPAQDGVMTVREGLR